MIPYFTIPTLDLFGLELQPFFLLVATGVVVGVMLYDRLTRLGGLIDRRVAFHLPELAVIGGFLGAHLMHVLAYHPELLARDPWVLLKFWNGISSVGGFLGGFLAVIVYVKAKRQPLAPYADRLVIALVAGWIFGRLGCTVTHDHPGLPSDFLLAVQFPDGPHHDLGFYEFLVTLGLAAGILWLMRRPRHTGTYMAFVFMAYAPLRFLFDFLRIREGEWADARYLGLTPAQIGMVGLFGVGLWLCLTRRQRPTDVALWPFRRRPPDA